MKLFLLIFFISSFTPCFSQQTKEKKIDPVEVSLNHLKKELNLDGFQEAVIFNLLKTHFDQKAQILELNVIDEEKIDKLKLHQEKLDRDIVDILNTEQKEKFILLKDKSNKKKKKK